MFQEENDDFYVDRKAVNRTKHQSSKQKNRPQDLENKIHCVGKNKEDKLYRNMERQFKNCDPSFVAEQFEDFEYETFQSLRK